MVLVFPCGADTALVLVLSDLPPLALIADCQASANRSTAILALKRLFMLLMARVVGVFHICPLTYKYRLPQRVKGANKVIQESCGNRCVLLKNKEINICRA